MSRQYLLLRQLSIFWISKLLLTGFWPNFKCRFLGSSWHLPAVTVTFVKILPKKKFACKKFTEKKIAKTFFKKIRYLQNKFANKKFFKKTYYQRNFLTEKILQKNFLQKFFFERAIFFGWFRLVDFWFCLVGLVFLNITAVLGGNSTYKKTRKLIFGMLVQLTKTR